MKYAHVLALAAIFACGSNDNDESSTSADGTRPGPGGGGPQAGPESTPPPSETPPDAGPPPAPYVHFDINHILSTGQSNAVANDAVPILSGRQPYANLMFDVGVMTGSGCEQNGCSRYDKPTSFVPLVEGDTFFYPIETMSSGLANEVTKLARERLLAGTPHPSHDLLVSLHGRSGNSYACLRKGGCDWWPGRSFVMPFDDAMKQVEDAKALAAAAGKSYAVRAVTAIHGEHEHYGYSSNNSIFPLAGTNGLPGAVKDYTDALVEWQSDYEASVKAITGQTVPVPLFLQQLSHWNDVPYTKIAFMQLDAHLRAPGKIFVVGPTYALTYTGTCLHFTNHAERNLGEYFAKAYARVIIEGKPWEPLRPTKATLDGTAITTTFHVPVPPLVLDTTRLPDPGNYGFELDDGTPITKVEIAGPDTVKITLASKPPGPARLRYAYTFRGCAGGGSGSVAHGNLRDSDATPSESGYELFNWSVHFDIPVE